MLIPQFQVDAFTKDPFGGNPAAVVLLGNEQRDAAWMQSVAAENNLSETAFIRGAGERDRPYGIRWFTPTREIDLCGHATLASAHVLWELGATDPTHRITFNCAAHGDLVCRRDSAMIAMDFPIDPPQRVEPPMGLLKALGIEPAGSVEVLRGREDYLVVVEDVDTVARVLPDFAAMSQIDTRGVFVTAASTQAGTSAVSRCFFPRYGINEDPVTGGAHCALGPYWAQRLSETRLSFAQLSQRGGYLRVVVKGEVVEIAGHAVTTIRSELLV